MIRWGAVELFVFLAVIGFLICLAVPARRRHYAVFGIGALLSMFAAFVAVLGADGADRGVAVAALVFYVLCTTVLPLLLQRDQKPG